MPKPTYNLIYPASVDNDFKKHSFCYRIKQLLIEEHNKFGLKYKNGEISEQVWLNYLDTVFEPKHDLLVSEILMLRDKAKKYDWNVTLNETIMKV